jgi:hypothetical protein
MPHDHRSLKHSFFVYAVAVVTMFWIFEMHDKRIMTNYFFEEARFLNLAVTPKILYRAYLPYTVATLFAVNELSPRLCIWQGARPFLGSGLFLPLFRLALPLAAFAQLTSCIVPVYSLLRGDEPCLGLVVLCYNYCINVILLSWLFLGLFLLGAFVGCRAKESAQGRFDLIGSVYVLLLYPHLYACARNCLPSLKVALDVRQAPVLDMTWRFLGYEGWSLPKLLLDAPLTVLYVVCATAFVLLPSFLFSCHCAKPKATRQSVWCWSEPRNP